MKSTTALPRTTRLLSLVVSLLMVASLAVVQAAPASAAATGWARLVAGVTVLPGAASYGVQVETQADAVDALVVSVPAGIGITATDVLGVSVPGGDDLGFTGTVQTVGSFQRVILTGGEIPANSNAVVRFNADISLPAAATDRSGTYKVQLSSDGGDSFEVATTGARDPRTSGTLTTTIKFLEVEAVEFLSPSGITDGTGTEGQDIKVRTTVRNYSSIPVTVDAALRAASPDTYVANEEISAPVQMQVLGNSTNSATFDVKLGTARQQTDTGSRAADRPVTFLGSVTETVTGATGLGTASDDFTVQILGRINFDGESFAPRVVAPSVATFTVNATHSGTPAFDVSLGQASVSFAETTATTQQALAFAKGNDPQTLSFVGQVQGEDAAYAVSATYMATDENGHTYMQTLGLREPAPLFGTRDVTVRIDALAPILSVNVGLPRDADARQQTAAKDRDTLSISGTNNDRSVDVTEVQLLANGRVIATKTADDISNSDPVGSDQSTFSTSFSGEEVDFPGSFGSFLVVAYARDAAGNLGVGFSSPLDFDNYVPRLDSARVESTLDVNQSILGQVGEQPGVISVRFDENALIRGGCNPNQWSIDGQNVVREVQDSNGNTCGTPMFDPQDNDRLLILSVPVEREATPLVRYSPIPGDRVGDPAGNLAPEDTVTAVSGIVPAAPDLLDVYRNTAGKQPEACQSGDCEDAYMDGPQTDRVYWNRFDGNDSVVCVAGARPGYSIEVTDENGSAILGTRTATTDSTPCVRVPIGSADQTYVRGIRFVNSAGAGDVLYVNIALDTVLPEITDVARSGDSITVSFNDQLVEGNNSALNWLVYERLADGSAVAGPPNRVSTPGDALSTDRTKRVLTGSFEENGEYIGIGYVFFSGDRYGDRGGNKVADAPGPIS